MSIIQSNIEVNSVAATRARVNKRKSPARARSHHARVPLARNARLGVFGREYRIDKLIGMGSFSLVYSAIETGSNLSVVIKEYFPKRYAKRNTSNQIVPLSGRKKMAYCEGVKNFHNEALVLKQISHPNVLDVYDLLPANNTTYLVSLNKSGRDLKWFLSSYSGALKQKLFLRVFMPILSALHFLHDSRLLHLDIKPANILLQPNSESVLLDFGAARSIDSVALPLHKQIVTHGYAPPEQYGASGGYLGPWTDIYAMAATMYFSITGNPPAKSKERKIHSRLIIERYSNTCCPKMMNAINQALLYDVSKRFQSIDEFAAALLQGSDWSTLVEFEADVMAYDRFDNSIKSAQDQLARFAA
jgi:serine/threonine protein kinase